MAVSGGGIDWFVKLSNDNAELRAEVKELRDQRGALTKALRDIAHDHDATATQCRLAAADALIACLEACQAAGASAGEGT